MKRTSQPADVAVGKHFVAKRAAVFVVQFVDDAKVLCFVAFRRANNRMRNICFARLIAIKCQRMII